MIGVEYLYGKVYVLTRVVYAWYGSVSLVTFLLRKVWLCAHERAASSSLALVAPTSVVVACLCARVGAARDGA